MEINELFTGYISVAQSQHTREELRDRASYRPRLRLRDVAKIAEDFPTAMWKPSPGTAKTGCARMSSSTVLISMEAASLCQYFRRMDGSLAEVIERAITRKEKICAAEERDDPHPPQQGLSLFHRCVSAALESLAERLANSPFRENWFHSSYCSNTDGRHSHYTLMGCKVAGDPRAICRLCTVRALAESSRRCCA